jgi:hypothetical protein
MRSIVQWIGIVAVIFLSGCSHDEPTYGREKRLLLVSTHRQVWAVAPAVNLSGQGQVDVLLQADLVYEQLQQVNGLTVIPVNRVAEVYASLKIQKVQSEEQASLVCQMLGCDRLLVPTVTIYDPFNPPKLGAALQLFAKGADTEGTGRISVRELARRAAPEQMQPLPPEGNFVQVVGMYDAAAGSVREAIQRYAEGRSDPKGPYGPKEYLVSMDRYCGFVYHELIAQLLASPRLKRS